MGRRVYFWLDAASCSLYAFLVMAGFFDMISAFSAERLDPDPIPARAAAVRDDDYLDRPIWRPNESSRKVSSSLGIDLGASCVLSVLGTALASAFFTYAAATDQQRG